MSRTVRPTRRDFLAALVAAPTAQILSGCGAPESGQPEDEPFGQATEALTNQQRCDSFYDIANVPTIRITLAPADWEALRTQQPAGGTCNFEFTGDRYTWFTASEVRISGSTFPAGETVFTNVGIKKKSFCGSISSTVPCLKLDFGKFRSANTALAESLIGTRFLTLNNSVQDPSLIRQALGYKLFQLAGLPNSRCNFAKVFVNGIQVSVFYVNVEPIRERYIERNFANNLSGNLYELEVGDDFLAARIPFIDVESLSRFDDKKDLTLAAQTIATNGLTGAAQVVDMAQFIRVYAMEFLLKHWDGYTQNRNNTYLYNDVAAVANPTTSNVKFKLIPWGLDQILQPTRRFRLSSGSVLGDLTRNDATRLAEIRTQVDSLRESVFSHAKIDTVLKPFIDQMEALLTAGNKIPGISGEITKVRQQLKLVRSAAFLFNGGWNTRVSLVDKATGDCLHASNTESVPAGATNPVNFETVHAPLVEGSTADTWEFKFGAVDLKLMSSQTGRFLHASASFTGTNSRFLNYTTLATDSANATEWNQVPVDASSVFDMSGYIKVRSVRTGRYLRYGVDDPTPGTGRPRVDQGSETEAAVLSLY